MTQGNPSVAFQERFHLPLKVGYFDQPYLGVCARYNHYHPDGRCWDEPETHWLLIQRAIREFPDGWAMSATSVSLRVLLPMCPPDVRVAAWVKPFAAFKKNVNPAYTWEPIIWRGGRKIGRFEDTVKDHRFEDDPAVSEVIQLKKGLVGAKGPKFCRFVFDLLGLRPWDTFVDVFPGTGAVTRAWQEFAGMAALPPIDAPHEGPCAEGEGFH